MDGTWSIELQFLPRDKNLRIRPDPGSEPRSERVGSTRRGGGWGGDLRRTCDGVVVLGRGEEEAVGLADLGAEGLDGGREAAAAGLEVGVDEGEVGDVEVVDAQPRDGVLAHLRGCRSER